MSTPASRYESKKTSKLTHIYRNRKTFTYFNVQAGKKGLLSVKVTVTQRAIGDHRVSIATISFKAFELVFGGLPVIYSEC